MSWLKDGAALVATGVSLSLPQPALKAMTAPAAKAKTRRLMFMLEGLLLSRGCFLCCRGLGAVRVPNGSKAEPWLGKAGGSK